MSGKDELKSRFANFNLIYKEPGNNLKEIVKNVVNNIRDINEYHQGLLQGYVSEEKIISYDYLDGALGSSGLCVSPYENDDGTVELVLESFSEHDGHTEFVGHFFVEDILSNSFDEKQLESVLYDNLIIDSKELNELEKSIDRNLSMDDFDRLYGYKTLLIDATYPALEKSNDLEKGILQVKNHFNVHYGRGITFSDTLKYYGKTFDEFEEDCRLFYKKERSLLNSKSENELER